MRSPPWIFIILAFLSILGSPAGIPAAVRSAPAPEDSAISHLPLIELPVPNTDNDILAIILSGDGGWADLDKVFGGAFQKRGISTVGFDCLKYFWKTRRPTQVSRDLEMVVRYYLKTWQKKRVLLVGYSFGACWLPFLVNRLPEEILSRVQLSVLLAPGSFVNIEIHMRDWMGDDRREGALDVLPEAAQIRPPVLCVYGGEEEDTICPSLTGGNVKTLKMPGGHHFDYQYDQVIDAIFKTLEDVKTKNSKVIPGLEKP